MVIGDKGGDSQREYERPPIGPQAAVCTHIVDMGSSDPYNGTVYDQVALVFALGGGPGTIPYYAGKVLWHGTVLALPAFTAGSVYLVVVTRRLMSP
jgi:hypothetical protein